MENVISKDVALADFYRFIELNMLDADESTMNQEELADFNKVRRTVTNQIMAGHLVVNEDGTVTYTPHRSAEKNPITFYEPNGSAFIAMDRKKKGEDVGKMFATMGDMCRVDPKVFARLTGLDVKVCMAVATLFLA